MIYRSTRSWLLVPLLVMACGGGAGSADDSAADGGSAAIAGSAGRSPLAGAGTSSGGGAAAAGGGAPLSVGGNGNAAGSAASGSAGKTSTGGTSGAGGAAHAGSGGTSGASAGVGGKSSGGASSAGAGGATQTGSFGPSASCKPWPAATGSTQKLTKTQSIAKDFDGKLQRFVSDGLGDGDQGESQSPLFELADGATLENVIIGAPAADGIHCLGTCTLKNVWWEDVGEDAATLKGSSSSQVMTIDCGGAKLASDKIFQHDGPGTMKISNFYAETFGKLYRSCGNCSKQSARHVVISGISADGGKVIAGVNANYDDTAAISNILLLSATTICERFTGNDTGAEPPELGAGPDGKVCIYQLSDIHSQ